jgi:hypothetical protein
VGALGQALIAALENLVLLCHGKQSNFLNFLFKKAAIILHK